MNKYIYTATYIALSLGNGSIKSQGSEILVHTDLSPLEDKKNYMVKSFEASPPKTNLDKNNLKEESPVIINYSNQHIVPSNSYWSLLETYTPTFEITLEKIPEKVTGIDFSENPLGNEGVKLLCDKMMKNSFIRWIDLSFTHMAIEGLKEVVNLLNHNKNIDYICVAGNPAISIKSNDYFQSLEGYLLKRLVLVSEEKLYTNSLNLFLEQHRSYHNGQLIRELREQYERFYDLKTGKTFAERYLSYNEAEDCDGEKALKIASKMMNMQRYDILKEFCKKAIAKGNGEAARYLALQYDRGHLTDEENGYVKYIKQGRDLKDFQCQKEYIYLKNQGLIDEF